MLKLTALLQLNEGLKKMTSRIKAKYSCLKLENSRAWEETCLFFKKIKPVRVNKWRVLQRVSDTKKSPLELLATSLYEFVREKALPEVLFLVRYLGSILISIVLFILLHLKNTLPLIAEIVALSAWKYTKKAWKGYISLDHRISQHMGLQAQRSLTVACMILIFGLLGAQTVANASLSSIQQPTKKESASLNPDKPRIIQKQVTPATGLDITGSEKDSKDKVSLAPAEVPHVVTVEVKPGDTLGQILENHGVDFETRTQALTSLKQNFNARRLVVGQKIELTFDPRQDALFGDAQSDVHANKGLSARALKQLKIRESFEKDVVAAVNDDGNGFTSFINNRPLQKVLMYREGEIESSLFEAASHAGVPQSIMAEKVNAFSYDVDFQREIRSGDKFTVFFEVYLDEDGNFIRSGNILKSTLMVNGEPKTIYGFSSEDPNNIQYFDDKGQSVQRALLRTPLKYGRISSGFGMRKHPILGYSKMHKGVDFAAPTGTPIRAAGDGIVTFRGWKGGYGNLVQIKHGGGYTTAYGHISRFAKGLKNGERVKQGEIIAYVGNTGRSTGPHLHYEILKNGVHTNPMKVKLPNGKQLAGQELMAFQLFTRQLDKQESLAVKAENQQLVAETKKADKQDLAQVSESSSAPSSVTNTN